MASRAGKVVTEMVPTIRKTSDLVQEIAAASSEQSSGVSRSMAPWASSIQATQQNASASDNWPPPPKSWAARPNSCRVDDLLPFGSR